MNVAVSHPSSSKWELEWPTEATPEAILDWGMTIRANLLERDKDFSDLVWGRGDPRGHGLTLILVILQTAQTAQNSTYTCR